MNDELNMMETEMEGVETAEEKDGNLGLVLGLGALGGLAIGAGVNGIVKGIKKLKAKKAEKEDKPKEKKTPFWKRKKAKEETTEEPTEETVEAES